jgi:hypothetical protein
MSASPSPQSGGVNSLQMLIASLDSPYRLLFGAILVLIMVFPSAIPTEYRSFADTILGRILGVGVVYGVIQTFGWVYGLLTTLAFMIILYGAPRLDYIEGFSGGGSINEKKIVGKRWFVEKVLGEKVKNIETDKVQTSAIEGITSGSMMN